MVKNINKNRIFRFNRRIRGLTDYNKRLELLKSASTRVVVRKSNKSVTVQFVDFDSKGDKVLAAGRFFDLESVGVKSNTVNLSTAYLTGYLAGKRFLKKDNKECIFDFGVKKPFKGGRIFAAVKGVVDSGVNVKFGGDFAFLGEDRLDGKHLSVDKVDVKKIKEKIDKL